MDITPVAIVKEVWDARATKTIGTDVGLITRGHALLKRTIGIPWKLIRLTDDQ